MDQQCPNNYVCLLAKWVVWIINLFKNLRSCIYNIHYTYIYRYIYIFTYLYIVFVERLLMQTQSNSILFKALRKQTPLSLSFLPGNFICLSVRLLNPPFTAIPVIFRLSCIGCITQIR